MGPWLLAPFPEGTEATATLTAEGTGVVGSAAGGEYALGMAAVQGSVYLYSMSSRATGYFNVAGRYGATLAGSGAAPGSKDVSTTLAARLGWSASPSTNLYVVANGLVASRLGIRASDELGVRDPFSLNRVIYTTGAGVGVATAVGSRGVARVDAAYAQAGAVAAELPGAAGIDSHAFSSSLSYYHRATPRLRLGPMVRLGYTHYEHALLSASLVRGQADVAAATLVGVATYEVTPRIFGTFRLGATAAMGAVTGLAPEARVEARLIARRYLTTLGYGHVYGSLGPRIGFGGEHVGFLEIAGRPRQGAAGRDTLGRVVVRLRRGTATLAGGELTTTGLAAAGSLSWPLSLGWLLGAGLDLERVEARITPYAPGNEPVPSFRGMLTISVTAIGATDPERRLPRNPGLDVGQEDERAAPAEGEGRPLPRPDAQEHDADGVE